jgi:hypothetical protein
VRWKLLPADNFKGLSAGWGNNFHVVNLVPLRLVQKGKISASVLMLFDSFVGIWKSMAQHGIRALV